MGFSIHGCIRTYWIELFLTAYALTAIDIIFTSRGLLSGIGKESSPFVTILIPSSDPVGQVLYMTIASIVASLGMFAFVLYLVTKHDMHEIKIAMGISSIPVCLIHLFGVATWVS